MIFDWRQLVEHVAKTRQRVRLVTSYAEISEWLRHNVGTHEADSPIDVLILSDEAALAKWMGRVPDWTHQAETALNLAAMAHRSLQGQDGSFIGLGMAGPFAQAAPAALHIATQTAVETRLYSFESVASHADEAHFHESALQRSLHAVSEATGFAALFDGVDTGHRKSVERAHPLIAEVWLGRAPIVWASPNGSIGHSQPCQPGGVLSGAFNPLHDGHLRLHAAAEQFLQAPVCFELPIFNADKPPLDYLSIAARCGQFKEHPVALTGAATFVEKVEIFPDSTFVVGVDTVERVVDPRFYGGSLDRMLDAFRRIDDAGCRFLVAGRKVGDEFVTLGHVGLPQGTASLFVELPEQAFRADASSTEIRRDRR